MSSWSRRPRRDRLKFWNCYGSVNSLFSRLFVSWETEVFNKPLFNWGIRHARYLKPWFILGVGFGLALMVITFFLMLFWIISLVMDTWSEKAGSEGTQVSGQVLTIVIPGVNMPWSDLPYMILAMAISVGFHELGHAIAAASEGVPIEHVAVFLACLVPGALIALDQESLELLAPIHSLRIYCAGIWHNLMCCAGCYLFLLLFQSIISPLNTANQYLVVSNINADSPFAGHLDLGDSILSVGGLRLQKPEDWLEFVYNHNRKELAYFSSTTNVNVTAEESPNLTKYIAIEGFCVCSENSQKHENILRGFQCPDDSLLFYRHSCTNIWPSSRNIMQNIYCLRAVDVVECSPCSIKQNTSESCGCTGSNSCLLPVLKHGEVFVGMKLQRSSLENCRVVPKDPICERNMVFVGDAQVLSRSLQLAYDSSQKRGGFGYLESLLTYTFSVSAAMALLNSALVFYLDGEQIFRAGLGLIKSWVPPRRHRRIMHVVLTLGTTLMCLLLIFSINVLS